MSEPSEEKAKTNNLIKNPHLLNIEDDVLFHIGMRVDSNLKEKFGDVKFVCMGGSTTRMEHFAKLLQNELSPFINHDCKKDPQNVSNSDRYVVYKVGPVLAVSHGIGIPSLMVILHETLKLLHYAGATNVSFFRIGTSGGLGLERGTVVLTKSSMNGLLQPYHEQEVSIINAHMVEIKMEIILGKVVKFAATLDDDLRKKLMDCSKDLAFPIAEGHTMCTNDFYEGQGRLDGAFCDYTLEDKLEFLDRIYQEGVRNIEMESVGFAAMCKRAGVPAAVLCVIVVDRLQGDQVDLTSEQHVDFQSRPQKIVVAYFKRVLEEEAQKPNNVP